MISFIENNVRLEFLPLENGRNQYAVNLHDFGNLESIIDRVIDGQELNDLITIIKSGKYAISFLRYL